MIKSIQQILQKYLPEHSTIIIGVSGGPDSIFLLQQCLEFQKIHPLSIVVAHVNHGLRGKESVLDAEFVKSVAQKNNLLYEEKILNLNTKKGNKEALGRNGRYKFFENLRRKHSACFILTAHTLNDSIETALFNLIRGSLYGGIKGISFLNEKKHLLRPLLKVKKTEILHYLKKNNIPYRTDQTNFDTKFSRNLIRQEIIPLLQKINPHFEDTFAVNLENFMEISNFLDSKSEKWLEENSPPFSLKKFLSEPLFFQKNILVSLYKRSYQATTLLTHKQLEEILKVLQQNKANVQKEFGPKYTIMVTKNKNERVVQCQKTTSARLKRR